MKRVIAIILTLMLSVAVFTGCGSKNGNVSNDPNGKIGTDAQSTTENMMPSTGEKQDRNDTHSEGNSIMDDIGEMADDTGDMIGNIGREMDDTMSGKDDTKENHTK